MTSLYLLSHCNDRFTSDFELIPEKGFDRCEACGLTIDNVNLAFGLRWDVEFGTGELASRSAKHFFWASFNLIVDESGKRLLQTKSPHDAFIFTANTPYSGEIENDIDNHINTNNYYRVMAAESIAADKHPSTSICSECHKFLSPPRVVTRLKVGLDNDSLPRVFRVSQNRGGLIFCNEAFKQSLLNDIPNEICFYKAGSTYPRFSVESI